MQCNQRAKRACIAEAGLDRKLSCVAAPRGPEAMCAGRRVHRAHAAIGEGTSNVLLVPVSVPPPQSAAPVVHPCIKVSAPQLYLSFQEARQPEPQRFRRKELGSNERFWQQSPKWNVSKPHACPLGLSVNKPLSIRGRRGPRPGAETAY